MSTTSPTCDVNGLRVAVTNWRDEWHPAAGGAEVFAGEMARGLVARGAHVIFLTARGRGQARREYDEGVEYLRRGGRWTVYVHVLLRVLARRHRLDAVIDCQNGIPFFTPLVVRRRTAVLCVIHHVHQHQFALHFHPWLAAVGRLLEGPVGRVVYGRRPVIAVSPGTRSDVRQRLRWRGPVHVVPNGTPRVHGATGEERRRSSSPTIVTVARLVAHKRLDRLVQVACDLRRQLPDLRVHLVGTGPDEARLRRLVADLGVRDTVCVHGWVDEAAKDALLDSAWLTVNPTVGEGWGIGVMEAAARGVPAVAYDVPGMRDSIRPTLTGWLARDDGDITEAVRDALQTLRDPTDAAIIGLACEQWAAEFTWPDSVDRLAAILVADHTVRTDRSSRRDRRRRSSDLVTLAEFEIADPTAFADAGQVLRPTDRWGRTGSLARHHGWVLAGGADDEDLAPVIARIGGTEARFRVALPADLLQKVPDPASAPVDSVVVLPRTPKAPGHADDAAAG